MLGIHSGWVPVRSRLRLSPSPLSIVRGKSTTGCGGSFHCQRPLPPFHRFLVLATCRTRRAESIAPLHGRPCPLYATSQSKTGFQAKECGTDKNHPVSDFLVLWSFAMNIEPRSLNIPSKVEPCQPDFKDMLFFAFPSWILRGGGITNSIA